MKHFFRSLRYLKPYRARLAISVVAVIFIAVLWGGGLGLLLPGMNILIAPEGLHGWAWNSMTKDRVNAFLVRRVVPPDTKIDGQAVSIVLDVVDPYKGGRAYEGGIRQNDWLVGIVAPDGTQRFIRGDVLVRELALWDTKDRIVDLLVYSSHKKQLSVRKVKLHRLRFASQMLGEVVQKIPEPTTRQGRTPMWLWLLVIVLAVTVLRNIFRFIQEYLVETAVQSGMWDLRTECYNVALRQPVTFFAAKGTTDTMSRFVQDTTELSRAQVTLFGKTLAEPAKAIASILMALFLSWQLTLIAMIGGPIVYVIIRKFGKIMKKSTRRALESWSDMLAVLEETLVGIRVVKAYTMEAAERKRFNRVNRQLFKQQRRMARIGAATSPTVEVIGMFAGMLAAGGAGCLVLHDRMDPYMFMAWMGCLVAMFDPVRKLSKVLMRFQRGDAAAERIFELRDREQEKRIPGAPMLPRHSKKIEFVNVSYRYPGVTDFAVRNVNLMVPAGQTIAIVGPNGSGKTTLMSMLPRLLEATEGQILLDGADISTHSLRSLRRQIAIVTQETVIFNATIAENISYGLRRPTQQQVLDASRKAFVDEFVREMPEGYETPVGQRGATLSGGQRQRIAIARAILRDPSILIFDEALSQIDPDSEQRIHQAMEEFIRGRTAFMIAHRFQTILSADSIVVMDAGQIVDIGDHEQLMDRCELYRHLYKTQFGLAK
jgi:ABC-type multidrug transport system fused ATPase/permease subunit